MKQKLITLVLLVCCLSQMATATASTSSLRYLTEADVLQIVQRNYVGQDVDYYMYKENGVTSRDFLVFVDIEPTKGWEHDCCLLAVPKMTVLPNDSIVIAKRSNMRFPSSTGTYTPLMVKDRYGESAKDPIRVSASEPLLNGQEAGRTYAIILSGGGNVMANYERYWNDCSFIYQTLTKKYGIPKDQIYPIMSDGNDSAPDLHMSRGGFKSQCLDLDGDGTDDIQLAASRDNIRQVLTSLSKRLKADDHLFFYVIDHGGTTDYITESYICLWGNEKLYDQELSQMLTPFTNKYVNVNVVMGQCYSGGFIDDLTKVGCVVATASKGSQPSYGCKDMPFDEFVYHWTCAVNGADHLDYSIENEADTDKNGFVTMEEAFAYAKLNDRVTQEQPQYLSTPISIGEDLAFNKIPPSVDLYIKDNPEDTGKEPNITIEKFWKSPSIWIRNSEDGVYLHENPIYSSDHQMAFIYVRVHNRGKKAFGGMGQWLHVYWAKASAGISEKTWKGREMVAEQFPTGGHLDGYPIPIIQPGGYEDIVIRWALPQVMDNDTEGEHHFCILAKIMDTVYDDGFSEDQKYFEILESNNQAQKNVTLIKKRDVFKKFNLYIRNTTSDPKSYSIEIIPGKESVQPFYQVAKVKLVMSPIVHAAWKRGGLQSQNLELPGPNSSGAALRTVRYLSSESKLQAINLNGGEFGIVQLNIEPNPLVTSSSQCTFDLIQKDETGAIVGGETFQVELPGTSGWPLSITSEPLASGEIQLSVESPNLNAVKWTDAQGVTIGNAETVTVMPKMDNDIFKVEALSEDGDMAIENISLEANYGIKSITATSAANTLSVDLNAAAPENARILLRPLFDGSYSKTQIIPFGANSVSVETNDLTGGIYVVTYYINADIIDQEKIRIK